MKARYSKDEHCLQELADDNWPRGDDAVWEHDKVLEMKEAARNARKLLCSDDFKGEDGNIYEEGVDYKVGTKNHDIRQLIATPIQASEESEEQVLKDFIEDIMYCTRYDHTPEAIIKAMRERYQFTITRKQ